MFSKTYQELAGYAPDYTVVPLCREIYADTVTPINLLRKIAALDSEHFLLESVEGGTAWARYSFLGYAPLVTAVCKDGTVFLDGAICREERTDDPMSVLRDVLSRFRAPRIPGMPPFTGGFVGSFSYEMFGYAEPTLKLNKSSSHDFDLMLFDKVIAYDHLTQKISVIANVSLRDGEAGYRKACGEIDRMIEKIEQMPMPPLPPSPQNLQFSCNMSKEAYCMAVEKAKQYIRDGDIFQVVPSRRFEAKYSGSLINAYRVLRATNPSPYLFYLKTKHLETAGSSPETLVKLKDGMLSTFPIAGTKPRGATPEEDAALEQELLADEKELSEHNMLVDLARNDIGRIANFGTVQVEDYMKIQRYSRVMHITSVVTGEIREEYDAFDAISMILPAGTLSGAPKIRACEIISELEPDARGVYGGAVGYLDFTGNMDVCIAIRMAYKKEDTVYVQAGAGVVADSVPELEYKESGDKAGAVIHALNTASEVTN